MHGAIRQMHLESDVCIIGGGAIGKTAALALSNAGIRVTLLAAPAVAGIAASEVAPSWDVRVYALNQTARRLLSALKVWDALDASRIAPVDAMRVFGDGEAAGKLSFDAYGARADALTWIIEDRNLNQALDAALRFSPNLQVISGRAERLDFHPDRVEARLANGDLLSARLLVGADGAHSWVRGQCDIDLDYRPYGQRAVVTNFSCERPHHGAAFQWFTSGEGIVALLPLPGDRVSLVWSAPEPLAQALMSQPLEQLAARVSAFSSPHIGSVHPLQPEARQAFPLALIRPRSITAQRVALIGDAAHVVHPLAGHGMNLGFGDVAALTQAITGREPHRDVGDERVLGRYARARSEDVLLMQVATDGLERLFAAPFEPLRIARNVGLNLVDKLPFVKRQLISHALGRMLT
ncbi:2-octaprenyl-3-methyl-6-methoxy-1,4-benzoquinol hydroxylase [Noviherbaspirillum humi]|uniref:2-octaprenyl-3-methyl-6-methoxy-1,4-benzoquinol hydroxylase n=2 Tax=Noviherbaspirillum humi TaxID=1688639 RepID=A0A239LPZ3_9BURK|nr:2-octaprenyl-3-methyl-6-methoxy-1,4-benzoquinol hydroxylase [Noviherbaspirillum humi]